MANWAKLQEQLTGLPVVKRAKHGIHFDKGNGEIVANFSGKPCHYQDTDGLWKPIDTRLLLGADGFYGCPHSPVRVHKDGHVKVEGTDYQQYTELPSATGLVDNDCIVRTFSFGEQRMWVTEDGYRSEIQLNRIPTLTEARKLIASESGTLSKAYLKSLTTATDANGDTHTYSTFKAFRTWLAAATFPVVIDPDFTSSGSMMVYYGKDATWANARAASDNASTITSSYGKLGSSQGEAGGGGDWHVWRDRNSFDTSSLDDGAEITGVTLKFTAVLDTSLTDFDVQIVKLNFANFRPTDWGRMVTNDLDNNIWRNTSGMSINTPYTSDALSTSWINKTGTTHYALISSRDRANTEATGNEFIGIAGTGYATESYRPVLTVTYSAGGVPKQYLHYARLRG